MFYITCPHQSAQTIWQTILQSLCRLIDIATTRLPDSFPDEEAVQQVYLRAHLELRSQERTGS
jgi:hypothetical protein